LVLEASYILKVSLPGILAHVLMTKLVQAVDDEQHDDVSSGCKSAAVT
jgi:hypothetical protein